MEADDEKTIQTASDRDLEVGSTASGGGGGRMSITEEDVANASDGLTEDEDDDDDDDDLTDDDEEDYDIYYGGENEDLDDGRVGGTLGIGGQFNNNEDPEYFGYECLTVAQIKDLLSESIASVCSSVQVSRHFMFGMHYF